MYTHIYIYTYICIYNARNRFPLGAFPLREHSLLPVQGKVCTVYTRSPLEDSRLFGPSPWKVLATTYEKTDFFATQPLAKIF